jgi:hypothetical protein
MWRECDKSNTTYHYFIILLSLKVIVTFKITIEFVIDHY